MCYLNNRITRHIIINKNPLPRNICQKVVKSSKKLSNTNDSKQYFLIKKMCKKMFAVSIRAS